MVCSLVQPYLSFRIGTEHKLHKDRASSVTFNAVSSPVLTTVSDSWQILSIGGGVAMNKEPCQKV